jgi:ABC-2 type transport system permease protein
MRKIIAIAWKDIIIRFTDRNLLLLMIAAPLAVATIIGLAFGGLDSGDAPVGEIPVAVVNQDAGQAFGVNFGEIYLAALVPASASEDSGAACTSTPPADSPDVQDITTAVAFDAAAARSLVESGDISAPASASGTEAYVRDAARLAVEKGIYTATITIPSGFSEAVGAVLSGQAGAAAPAVEVYAQSGSPVAAAIVGSIAGGITHQLLTGMIALAAAFPSLGPAPAGAAPELPPDLQCRFASAAGPLTVKAEIVTGDAPHSTAGNILVLFGSGQAMFFALFTAQAGVLGMYTERRNGTLQRMIVSPTPRSAILTGKLIGVFTSVLFQLLALFVALTVVGSLLEGKPSLIWGTNLPGVALVMASAALGASGLGMLLAGILRSPEQGAVFGSVVNMGMAVLGGAFGFTLPESVSRLSMLYWGRMAFEHLASGQGEIAASVLVMAGQGLVMFVIGLVLFNRRFEV